MDPLTHTLLTRRLVGKQRRIVACSLAPDAPFYAVYPPYVVALGQLRCVLSTNDWPAPPRRLTTLHHAFHSLPVALGGALVVRAITGRWPRRELAAWTLHILVDIPTHRREPWGPRFLWPLSDVAMDGFLWVDGVMWLIKKLRRVVVSHHLFQRSEH